MTSRESLERPDVVTLWLDPVCPFSWNTARWLLAAADTVGSTLELRQMSLAVLNEARELPAAQQARMRDSAQIGRVMAALRDELGDSAFRVAYFAFAERYFDQSAPLDEDLLNHVLQAAGARRTRAADADSSDWDPMVRQAHEASQSALGGPGGSPMVTVRGHTVFGPVLSAPPDAERARAVFEALRTLIDTPQFHQVQRPRDH